MLPIIVVLSRPGCVGTRGNVTCRLIERLASKGEGGHREGRKVHNMGNAGEDGKKRQSGDRDGVGGRGDYEGLYSGAHMQRSASHCIALRSAQRFRRSLSSYCIRYGQAR